MTTESTPSHATARVKKTTTKATTAAKKTAANATAAAKKTTTVKSPARATKPVRKPVAAKNTRVINVPMVELPKLEAIRKGEMPKFETRKVELPAVEMPNADEVRAELADRLEDVQEAVVVDEPEVARMEPAVGQGRRGLVGSVPVAVHELGPAGHDLADLPRRAHGALRPRNAQGHARQ